MSEMEDIADMEFDNLFQHVDLGELDDSRAAHGQDLSEELLGVILAPADDTAKYIGDGTPAVGWCEEPSSGMALSQASSPSLSVETKIHVIKAGP